METFEVTISRIAQKDLREIVAYLHTRSPMAALRYYDDLVEKIGSLAQFPERCPLCRDHTLRMKGYRFMVVEPYLVFYQVKENRVLISRILYGRRGYEDLLH